MLAHRKFDIFLGKKRNIQIFIIRTTASAAVHSVIGFSSSSMTDLGDGGYLKEARDWLKDTRLEFHCRVGNQYARSRFFLPLVSQLIREEDNAKEPKISSKAGVGRGKVFQESGIDRKLQHTFYSVDEEEYPTLYYAL